ncbi:MAG: tRNA lysidine(34) synthetase TilS [Actinomycetota bacterium]
MSIPGVAGAGDTIDRLTPQVVAALAECGIEPAGGRLLVAFSGGPDSTALALILRRLNHDLALAHVDHGMRPGAELETEQAASLARCFGLPIQLRRVRVSPPTEAAARRERYRALEEAAGSEGAAWIATGHTLDDQAETVLLRLRRGGFPSGIARRRGIVVRPLLGVRRSETERVCREAGADPVIDPTNADIRLARNFVRHRVLRGVDDEVVRRIASLAEGAEAARDALEHRIAPLLSEVVVSEGAALRLDRRRLRALPERVAAAVVRSALATLGVEAGGRAVRSVIERVLPATGARADLPGGWAAWAEPGWVAIGLSGREPQLPRVDLSIGRTRAPAWNLDVVVEPAASPGTSGDPAREAIVDACALDAPLAIRPRNPGDRFRPAGRGGSRKLQDLFVDAKVPRAERDRIPLLVSGDAIVWVPGHGIDERFRAGTGPGGSIRVAVFPLLQGHGPGRTMTAR